MYSLENVRKIDPEIAESLDLELKRQRQKIELIASENFTSLAVIEAMGTVLTNKYAEGYPGKRYYGGCEYVDVAEQLAIDRAKKLFGAEHANVQPHSGAQANTAVYMAFVQPGDTIMGMDLSHGGHLTHGHPLNFSGAYFNFVPYGVSREDECIDYDEVEKIALDCEPKMIVAGASAYPRIIDFPRLRQIADKVGAFLFVDMAHIAGLVATGLHPSPVPYCEVVSTTTHKTLRGPRGGLILSREEFAKNVNRAVFPGVQGGPLMHIIAAKAIAFKEALQPDFKVYSQQVIKNAAVLASTLADKGFRIVSGGTDNHLMLVDVKAKGLTGKEAEKALDDVGITVNKNTIPFDTEKPFVTSGIRVGTPAMTTRGMKEVEMEQIGKLIAEVIENVGNAPVLSKVAKKVEELSAAFPLYEG